MKNLVKTERRTCLRNFYIKTTVINLTISKSLLVFKDLKRGLECSKNEEKVIVRIARFVLGKINVSYKIFISIA